MLAELVNDANSIRLGRLIRATHVSFCTFDLI
jgi:hypothetical protein